MDSQDNPERIFQICNFGKITSPGFDPWSAGKYRSKARSKEYMAEMCAQIRSMLEGLIPSSYLWVGSSRSTFSILQWWIQLLQHNCQEKMHYEGKRGLLPAKKCYNKVQDYGKTDGNVKEWSYTIFLAEILATSFLLLDLQYGQRYSWGEYCC